MKPIAILRPVRCPIPADEIVPTRTEPHVVPQISLEGETLVRDERGVRVARETDD